MELDTDLVADARPIIDDHFHHFLKVLVDEDSGGIRLQASVLNGVMKRYIPFHLSLHLNYLYTRIQPFKHHNYVFAYTSSPEHPFGQPS